MASWSKLLTLSFFLLLLLPTSVPLASAQNDDGVSAVLTKAEQVTASAYDAILEAEQYGTNVSSLLARLNLAGEYLAEAHVWYRLGVSDNVSLFAGLCVNVAEDVKQGALELRDEAKSSRENNFVVTVIGSSVGVISIIVLGSIVWRIFKRNHYRKILGLKPEVVSNES